MNEKDNNGTIDEKPKLLGMITRPTEQFIKLKQQPIIWVPLIIISLLMMLGTTITALNVDYANDPELQERSEEHTSELQSRGHLVCRLLLEKKKEHHHRSTFY